MWFADLRKIAYSCPNCDEPTFSFWTKQFLGPARSVRCKSCDAKVSVSWMWALIDAPSILLHFFVILVVGLEAGSRYGISVAFGAIVLVSVPFLAVFGWIRHRYAKLTVRNK